MLGQGDFESDTWRSLGEYLNEQITTLHAKLERADDPLARGEIRMARRILGLSAAPPMKVVVEPRIHEDS